ncbi:hypothetical protein [Microbacterium aurum]
MAGAAGPEWSCAKTPGLPVLVALYLRQVWRSASPRGPHLRLPPTTAGRCDDSATLE